MTRPTMVRPPRPKGGRWLTGILLLVLGVLVVYSLSAGEDGGVPCLVLSLTGWRCPGCGLQRAAHACLRGELAEAIRYNYSLLLLLPLLGLYLCSALVGDRMPRLRALLHHPYFLGGLGVLVLLWWLVRNLAGC